MNFKKRVNGSWVDTPNYLHNTSTDTITTLPAVIYPTGTTATVGLKGQTTQSSIPSPTSPVMPQGCGDLETTGEHTGQYKIPISSANASTPVYLGEVESTRRIKKLVLTGQEAWRSQYNGFTLSITKKSGWYTIICTHYPETDSTRVDKGIYNSSTHVIIIFDSDYENVTDFKTYLQQQYAAGTPVTIWYVLSTPQTAVVNEPLCKLGDYADEVSGITIPTIAGADSFDVLTTLKPSEVTVNYKGWHPVADYRPALYQIYDTNSGQFVKKGIAKVRQNGEWV